MAGTSWDKLGQMDAAFEIVAPAIRRVATESGVKLHEFFRDDPVWRLNFTREHGGEAMVDVAWSEETPDTYRVVATWWLDDYDSTMRSQRSEPIGEFRRDQPLEALEALLRRGVEAIDGWGLDDLTEKLGPYPDWQKYSTREEFGKIRLPKR